MNLWKESITGENTPCFSIPATAFPTTPYSSIPSLLLPIPCSPSNARAHSTIGAARDPGPGHRCRVGHPVPGPASSPSAPLCVNGEGGLCCRYVGLTRRDGRTEEGWQNGESAFVLVEGSPCSVYHRIPSSRSPSPLSPPLLPLYLHLILL